MKDDADYQMDRINRLLAEMETSFEEIEFLEIQIDYKEEEIWHDEIISLEEHKKNFRYLAESLYLTIITFLEAKNARLLLGFFIDKFKKYNNDDKLFKNTWYDEIGEYLVDFVVDCRQILNVYPGFEYGDEQLRKKSGIFYLEHILESTGVIINSLGKSVNSEAEVYKAVEIVCKATFREVSFSTSSFSTIAKSYRPDILIPSLNCAIEYKYAADATKLIKTVEEILIDVEGYKSHKDYKLFYAVFYVKAGIFTKSRFQEIWDEKNFPKNWKSIYVEWA